jgi:hypothetical protein
LKGELPERQFGSAVRLEVAEACPAPIAHFLLQQFDLSEADLYRCDGPVNVARLSSLIDQVDIDELKFEPFVPGLPDRLTDRMMAVTPLLLSINERFIPPCFGTLAAAGKEADIIDVQHPVIIAGFGDFGFWRLEPEKAHAVAGFGRIETIPANELFPSADEMITLEEGAVQHMNDDHEDAIQRYAEKLLGARPGGWKIKAIDPDGADLRRGDEVLRLPFETPAYSGGALRSLLARLGEQTRD